MSNTWMTVLLFSTHVVTLIIGIWIGWKEMQAKAVKDNKAMYTSNIYGYSQWGWK